MKCTCGEAVRFPDERSEEPCEARSQEGARARQNHAGGVPANCGSVSPERSEPRSGRYAGCEQVGRRPRLQTPPSTAIGRRGETGHRRASPGVRISRRGGGRRRSGGRTRGTPRSRRGRSSLCTPSAPTSCTSPRSESAPAQTPHGTSSTPRGR